MLRVGAFILIHEGCLWIQLFDHHPLMCNVQMHALGVPLGPTEAEKLLSSLVGEFGHLDLAAASSEHFQIARTLLHQIATSMDKVRWHRRQRLPELCLAYYFLMQSGQELGTLHLAHLEPPYLVLLRGLIHFDQLSLGGFILRQK